MHAVHLADQQQHECQRQIRDFLAERSRCVVDGNAQLASSSLVDAVGAHAPLDDHLEAARLAGLQDATVNEVITCNDAGAADDVPAHVLRVELLAANFRQEGLDAESLKFRAEIREVALQVSAADQCACHHDVFRRVSRNTSSAMRKSISSSMSYASRRSSSNMYGLKPIRLWRWTIVSRSKR